MEREMHVGETVGRMKINRKKRKRQGSKRSVLAIKNSGREPKNITRWKGEEFMSTRSAGDAGEGGKLQGGEGKKSRS